MYFPFHLPYKHSGTFADRKYKELSYPKKSENVRPHSSKCDPIIVNPVVKMRPHPAAHPHLPLIKKYPPGGDRE